MAEDITWEFNRSSSPTPPEPKLVGELSHPEPEFFFHSSEPAPLKFYPTPLPPPSPTYIRGMDAVATIGQSNSVDDFITAMSYALLWLPKRTPIRKPEFKRLKPVKFT